MSGADVVVDHVAKAFEGGHIAALVDATFRVDRGELVALTGPSGSGKSTLLNLLGALDRSDQGSIVVGGQRLETLDDPAAYRRDIVGFVFQFHNLLPTLSALENVQVPLIGRNGSRERAHALLEEVGLAPRAHARPAVLSGGERQRVAIARALANEPRLVLADEPTGALDSETGAQMLMLLRRLQADRGMTTFLVTNDRNVAKAADRVLHLHDGRVTPDGVPRSG